MLPRQSVSNVCESSPARYLQQVKMLSLTYSILYLPALILKITTAALPIKSSCNKNAQVMNLLILPMILLQNQPFLPQRRIPSQEYLKARYVFWNLVFFFFFVCFFAVIQDNITTIHMYTWL